MIRYSQAYVQFRSAAWGARKAAVERGYASRVYTYATDIGVFRFAVKFVKTATGEQVLHYVDGDKVSKQSFINTLHGVQQ